MGTGNRNSATSRAKSKGNPDQKSKRRSQSARCSKAPRHSNRNENVNSTQLPRVHRKQSRRMSDTQTLSQRKERQLKKVYGNSNSRKTPRRLPDIHSGRSQDSDYEDFKERRFSTRSEG